MALGDNIRRRRIELGLTQQAVADAMGYRTRSSIAKLEKNEANLHQDKLIMLARILNTSVDYLITGITPLQDDGRGEIVDRELAGDFVFIPNNSSKSVAVILAGGNRRVNRLNIPLQFVTVKDKPVIIYTLEAYQRHPLIDEIYVVSVAGWEDFISAYADKYMITKLVKVIPAGSTGIRSVRNAVEVLAPDHSPYDRLIIHEATRPLIDPETISNAILCCSRFGSGVTFERMDRMTPFVESDTGKGLTHIPADRLIDIQSPEVYTTGLLRQAFLETLNDEQLYDETICAVFLHNLGINLRFCEGNHSNYRIVDEDDLKLLESLI